MHFFNYQGYMMKQQILILLIACVTVIGCAGKMGQSSHSESLVEYLYPKDAPLPTLSPDLSSIHTPLRVGIAFVPPATHEIIEMTPMMQQVLRNELEHAFEDQAFIAGIQII